MSRAQRYRDQDLHPIVIEAIKRWHGSMMSASTNGTSVIPKKEMETYSEHQKVWWKTYGGGFAAGSALWVGWFGAAIAAAAITDIKAIAAAGVIAGIGGITAHCIWAYKKNVSQATLAELRILRPVVAENVRPEYLADLAKEYLDTFLAVESTGALDDDSRREARSQIYELMNQAQRVHDQMESLRAMAGDTLAIDAMTKDIEELRTKLNQANDPEARETFASALRIAEGRLGRLGSSAPIVERCEAQLAMIGQTLALFRETLTRTSAVPGGPGLDFSMLRQQIEAVQHQSNGLDAAFAELDRLRA